MSVLRTPPETPLLYRKSGVYIKVGLTRVYLFFLFLLQNIDCGYSLEPLRRFLRVPTIYVLSKNKKNIKKKSSENYHFYSREILQYIARTCLRNEPSH